MKVVLNPIMVPALFALGAVLMLHEKLRRAGVEDGGADMLPSSTPKDATTPPYNYAARHGVFKK